MTLQPVNDEALLVALSDGKVIMGLWPVLFGWRVRAGKVNEMYYDCDWCCGDDPLAIWATYEMMKTILESGRDVETLRPHSEIKPWFRDEEFSHWLIDQMRGLEKDVQIIVTRPSLNKLREEYLRKIEPFKNDEAVKP